MWDVDSSRTSALLEDMGVSVLPSTNTEQQTMFVDSDEEDQEMSSPPNQYPTPEILVVQNCQPPPVSACFQQVYFNPMSHLVDLRICLEKITRSKSINEKSCHHLTIQCNRVLALLHVPHITLLLQCIQKPYFSSSRYSQIEAVKLI